MSSTASRASLARGFRYAQATARTTPRLHARDHELEILHLHLSEPLRRIRDEQHGLASFARSRLSLRSSVGQNYTTAACPRSRALEEGQPARRTPEGASARSPLLTEARLNTTVSVARAGKARSLVSPARGPAEAETPQRRVRKQDAKTKITPQHAAPTPRVAAALPNGRVGDGHGDENSPELRTRCMSPARPRGTWAGRVFQRKGLRVPFPLGDSRTVLALESRVVIGGPKLKRQLYLYLYLYLLYV